MPPQGNGRPGAAPGKGPSPAIFIIIGAVILVILLIVIIFNIIRIATEKKVKDTYYDFYTKDEFNQMMEDMEMKERNRNKGGCHE